MRSADQYLSFTNSGFGKWVTGSLGLPQPVQLARRQAGKPDLRQPVLMGGAAGGRLTESLAALFRSANLVSLYHSENDVWREAARRHEIMTARYTAETSGKVGALLFDATGIEGATDLESLYRFFHETVRSVGTNGRIVVFGTTPEDAGSTEAAAIQRGLEGFTRSLGKEVHRAIAVQLVYVRPGAEAAIESTTRFFLSSGAAYVSGQVVRIAKPVAKAVEYDPGKPQAGRTVLVTGASRGIGAAIADLFAGDGAHVVALDIPPAAVELDAIAERLGGSALPLDITAPDAAEAILADAKRRGGYDVVVHNAGITRDKTIAKMDAGRWDSVMDVNLFAPLRITEALLSGRGIRKNGRVVCVSSLSGIAGNMGQTNYALSKAGLIGAVQRLAPEAAKSGITINAVAPGFIETQMTASIPFAIREAGRRMNAMSQGGLPIDVAEAIGWFASPGSGGVNGQTVRVCGQSLLGA